MCSKICFLRGDGPPGGDRDFRNKPGLAPFSVQDVEEDPKAAGEINRGEDEDAEDGNVSLSDSSEERTMETAEAAEAKQEMVAAKPQRRASTPPPPSLPVKLLTRLGSLDGELTLTNRRTCVLVLVSDRLLLQVLLQFQWKSLPPHYRGTSHSPKNLTDPCWEAGSLHPPALRTLGPFTSHCPPAASLRNCIVPWPPNTDRRGQVNVGVEMEWKFGKVFHLMTENVLDTTS